MGARLSVSQPDGQSTGQPEGQPLYCYRDNFFLTTDKSYLDPAAVNDVFSSDLMWWNDPMSPDMMNKMLQNCLTVAIYAVPETKEHMQRNGVPRRPSGPNLKLVGFSRLVTDYVSIAYLTDVFILPEYQRRGLAAWMMQAIKEMVSTWPLLRGMLVMTETEHAAELYKRKLGVLDFDKGPSAGLLMYEMPGNGCKAVPEGK